MKTFFITTIAAISFSACNSSSTTSKGTSAVGSDTAVSQTAQTQGSATETKSNNTPISAITTAYLQIKNGLANDNGSDAASGGKAFNEALAKIDKGSMSAEQKKTFEDIADDAKEMAEHIGTNAGKIEHQREHFDMLSKDMYDLVKTFGAGQPLYQDSCPMYNNNKGAIWLSETKEIKNPYMGKKQLTCGSVKGELK